ncbi:beta-propeller domain-containing protein [Spirillospora sp. NPDC048819]|uniref:beta-propeller domain-containing protein n=1 Tax=Spirillospora sp. NPDC048819 TaxID=3155268 RepID=UPI00340B089F
MRGRVFAPAATLLILAGSAGCAGSPGGSDRPVQAPLVRLVAYDSCAALHKELRQATADRVGPFGLSDGPVLRGLPEGGTALRKGPQAAEAAPGQPPRHSTTNAHERSADEPDLVKTDGRRIVTLAGGGLTVIDPATREITHTLDLPGSGFLGDGRLLLSGDRVLVLDEQTPMIPYERRAIPGGGAASPRPPTPPRPTTRLTLVDVSGAPKVIGTMTTHADYLDARQSGSTVRVVMRSQPDIRFPGGDGEKAATEANRQAVVTAPLDAWLPAFQVDDGNGGPATKYRTPCDQVSRPSSYAGSSMLSVLTFDLSKGLGDPQAIGVTADGSTVYGNGKSLYVTGTPPQPPMWRPREKRPEARTDVYKFDVSGTGRPRYVASGSVKGSLLNQYSMSEHDGKLRLATTTGQFAREDKPSQSSVYVLAQDGSRLDQIGRIDGLGKGERIYSVRFIGTTGYVVTFRQTDPLYALDLKDPRRPRLTGELKITGYSAYLHPTGDGRLLGVGQDADLTGRTNGLQVSLFDVSGEPRRISDYKLPGARSQAEFEPHAFLYWPDSGLTVIPVNGRSDGGGEALALKVTGSSITEAGTVRHPGRYRGTGIRRSLIVGGTLWTFSDQGTRATDAATLKNMAWLPFD